MKNREYVEKQEKYCEEHSLPIFISYNGICFKCGSDIFTEKNKEICDKELITGCPHCHKSFCD